MTTNLREQLAHILDPLAFEPAAACPGPGGLEPAPVDRNAAARRSAALGKVDDILALIAQATDAAAARQDLVERARFRVAALCWLSRDQMHVTGLPRAEKEAVKERRRLKWDLRLQHIRNLPEEVLSRLAVAATLDDVKREFEAARCWQVASPGFMR